MKILYISFLISLFSLGLTAQWSGDGYFLDNGRVWGTYETEVEQSNFGGVYYRIKHSSGSVINVNPIELLPDGRLYLRWKQYRAFQNTWYPEFSGEMIVDQRLLDIATGAPGLTKTTSPAGILIAGVFRGEIRTLLKYSGGVPYVYETKWAPIAWTINGGGATSTAFNPFDGLLEGYVLSRNGNIHGDYVLYRESGGGWGCLDGQYLHYYRSGGYYVTVICPTEFDVNTAEVKGIFYRYRTNSSNLDRSRGIWRVKDWKQDLAGEIKFFRVPSRCPDNSPESTRSGFPISACIHAEMKVTYKYSGGTPIEAREPWVPYLFTLMTGSTSAPTPVSSNPCDVFCNTYCQRFGNNAGRYNGSTICLTDVVSHPARGCSCEN